MHWAKPVAQLILPRANAGDVGKVIVGPGGPCSSKFTGRATHTLFQLASSSVLLVRQLKDEGCQYGGKGVNPPLVYAPSQTISRANMMSDGSGSRFRNLLAPRIMEAHNQAPGRGSR